VLTQEQCREIHDTVERLARAAGVRDVETHVGSHVESLTRFANNIIHQNVAERGRWLSVRVQLGQKTGRVTTNRFEEAAIQSAVDQALALAKAAEPNPDLLPLAEPETIAAVSRCYNATADATPEQRASGVTEAIRLVESAGQTAAGIYSTEHDAYGLFNSRGLAAYHAETMARFSITVMAEDSSGWAKISSTDRDRIVPVELARRASQKASASKTPDELPPGKYPVILEPAAVLDLVGQIFGDFSATAINDKRSFLTDRLGQPLFGTNINIDDDVYHPMQSGSPFDGEGVSRKRLKLVEAGVPREIAYSRANAHKAGVAPTGHGFALPNEIGEMPMNIVIQGGDTSLDKMIASTERGILVTRLWYIREVDPYEKIMTGMTRDGTFLVEAGEIVRGLRNFRFNQSVVELLKNVESLSPAVRASGEEAFDMVVPAIKAHEFNFTEVTRF